MTDRLEMLQHQAAIAAFEAYREVLEGELGESGWSLAILDGRGHMHVALMLDAEGGGGAVVARCTWEFSAKPELVAEAMKQAADVAAKKGAIA